MKTQILKYLYLLVAVSSFLACSDGDGQQTDAPAAPSDAELLAELQRCSKIYTGEYDIRKIIVQHDEKRISGKVVGIDVDLGIPGGERTIAIPVEGVVKAYVDLGSLTAANVARQGDSIHIVLPDPQILLTGTQVRHDEIKTSVGVMQSRFSDKDLTRIQAQGRDSLLKDIAQLGLVAHARENAARTLISLLKGLDFAEERITITFRTDVRDPLSLQEIKAFLVDAAD